MIFHRVLAACVTVALSASVLFGQGAQVAFGGLKHDATLPVEITADQLQLDQSNGTAIFSGNVLVGQGALRISAGKIEAIYSNESADATGKVSKMIASGGVTIVNGAEAAEANQATYNVKDGVINMTGDAILTQGRNALSANEMIIDLNSGTASMVGRVKTILQTSTGE